MEYEAERDSVQNTLDVTNSLVADNEREIQQNNLEVAILIFLRFWVGLFVIL